MFLDVRKEVVLLHLNPLLKGCIINLSIRPNSMDDQIKVSKLSATTLLFLWSIWLLQLVAQSLWAEIPRHFYEQVGGLLGYKVLLNLCLLFLTATISLIILYFSKHTIPNKTVSQLTAIDPIEPKTLELKEKTITSEVLFEPTEFEQKSLMEYLSASEKDFLRRFIDIDSKFILDKVRDPTANALVAKKIILIRHEATLPDINGEIYLVEFVLYEWTWKYIKDHPNILGKGLTGLTQRQKLLVVYLEERLSG